VVRKKESWSSLGRLQAIVFFSWHPRRRSLATIIRSLRGYGKNMGQKLEHRAVETRWAKRSRSSQDIIFYESL